MREKPDFVQLKFNKLFCRHNINSNIGSFLYNHLVDYSKDANYYNIIFNTISVRLLNLK